MISISALLQQDQARLACAMGLEIAAARFEVQLLMARALQVNRAWLIAHDDEILPSIAAAQYQAELARRIQGEPIAYIVGEKEFYGLRLMVTDTVLIPRPETELLVDLALGCLPIGQAFKVLDLGTGSGAIALSLAKLRPQAQLLAVDASAAALQVAQANAQHLQLPNIRFLESHWYQQISAGIEFDLIVSNPPYIAAGDRHLQQGDLRFEPETALVAGITGLDDLQAIVASASSYLVDGGWLMLEHGFDQAVAVRTLLHQAGFGKVVTHPDLAGIARVSLGQWLC